VSKLTGTESRQLLQYFECPACGAYALSIPALAVLTSTLKLADEKEARAKLSHAIHRMSRGRQWAQITEELLRAHLHVMQFHNRAGTVLPTGADGGQKREFGGEPARSVPSTSQEAISRDGPCIDPRERRLLSSQSPASAQV